MTTITANTRNLLSGLLVCSSLTGFAANLGIAVPIALAACGMAISAFMLVVMKP